MTQTLRDKVAEAIEKVSGNSSYDWSHETDAALQAIAKHIGCEVEGLGNMKEAIEAMEAHARVVPRGAIDRILAKLKGKRHDANG